MASAKAGHIFIVDNIGSTAAPNWVPTVDLNTPIPQSSTFLTNGTTGFYGDEATAFAAISNNLSALTSADLGKWGVIINNGTGLHEAFAVVNHNSEISVVPEPATMSLMGLSALGLVARRRRRSVAKAA